MTLLDYGIEHITLPEIVPKPVLDNYYEERALHFIDIRPWLAWNWIRRHRGNPIYFNTYGINAPAGYPAFSGRGLRLPTKAGLNTSQHYYGRAGDGDEYGFDNRELYDFCLNNQETLLSFGITTIENIEFTPTWVHIDCRDRGTNLKELVIVDP